MKKLFFVLLYIPFILVGQDVLTKGKYHVQVLSADSMFGRGYVNNGYEKALQYVEGEFAQYQLKPLGKSFRQDFVFPVNTFPDSVSVACNGKFLIPGQDFIVDEKSGTVKGDFTPLYVSKNELLNPGGIRIQSGVIPVILPLEKGTTKDTMRLMAAAINDLLKRTSVIEITSEKLTWSVSMDTMKHAYVKIRTAAFDKTTSTIRLNIHAVRNDQFISSNLVGYIPSSKKKCTDYVVVTAHLDHLGMMGSKAIFNGANDNASGVSLLLSLAEHYSKNPPKVNMLFIAFGAEEIGLVGSQYFVDHPLVDLKKMKFLLNVDLMGTGDDGITVVNATLFQKQFKLLQKINDEKKYVSRIKPRGEAANSDHYWFTKSGVPSFFIYAMGGTQAYHDVFDRPEQLPLTRYVELFDLSKAFLDKVYKVK